MEIILYDMKRSVFTLLAYFFFRLELLYVHRIFYQTKETCILCVSHTLLFSPKKLYDLGILYQIRKPSIAIVIKYRVTHKGWDFRDDCAKIVQSVFLLSGFLVGWNWLLSVFTNLVTIKYLIKCRNQKLNLKFRVYF